MAQVGLDVVDLTLLTVAGLSLDLSPQIDPSRGGYFQYQGQVVGWVPVAWVGLLG